MATKITKQLPTLGVAGAISGYVLKGKGFSEIHEVMDHLFPGIYTLGCAAMLGHAQAELSRQLPELAKALERYTDQQYGTETARIAAALLEEFGPTLPVDGPLAVTQEEITVAFASLG